MGAIHVPAQAGAARPELRYHLVQPKDLGKRNRLPLCNGGTGEAYEVVEPREGKLCYGCAERAVEYGIPFAGSAPSCRVRITDDDGSRWVDLPEIKGNPCR